MTKSNYALGHFEPPCAGRRLRGAATATARTQTSDRTIRLKPMTRPGDTPRQPPAVIFSRAPAPDHPGKSSGKRKIRATPEIIYFHNGLIDQRPCRPAPKKRVRFNIVWATAWEFPPALTRRLAIDEGGRHLRERGMFYPDSVKEAPLPWQRRN